jgi:hypothetical protein
MIRFFSQCSPVPSFGLFGVVDRLVGLAQQVEDSLLRFEPDLPASVFGIVKNSESFDGSAGIE